MVTKKRGRYEVSDKGKMIHELDKHLNLKGPNIGKPNFYLVAQMYPEYSRKLLIDWYNKKEAILSSHNKIIFYHINCIRNKSNKHLINLCSNLIVL